MGQLCGKLCSIDFASLLGAGEWHSGATNVARLGDPFAVLDTCATGESCEAACECFRQYPPSSPPSDRFTTSVPANIGTSVYHHCNLVNF